MSPEERQAIKITTLATIASLAGLIAGFALRSWEYGQRVGRQEQVVQALVDSRADQEVRLRAVELAVVKLSGLEELLRSRQ